MDGQKRVAAEVELHRRRLVGGSHRRRADAAQIAAALIDALVAQGEFELAAEWPASPGDDIAGRVWAFVAAAQLAWYRQDLATAKRLCEEAIDVAQGQPVGAVHYAVWAVCTGDWLRGDVDAVDAALDRAEAPARRGPPGPALACLLLTRAAAHVTDGRCEGGHPGRRGGDPR